MVLPESSICEVTVSLEECPSWGSIPNPKEISNSISGNNTNEKDLPTQRHHFATNKNKKYNPQMKAITDKYNIDLNGSWNIESMHHLGRHPNAYHKWVLESMREIDIIPNMNQQQFIIQFNIKIKQPVINNPDMLRKSF